MKSPDAELIDMPVGETLGLTAGFDRRQILQVLLAGGCGACLAGAAGTLRPLLAQDRSEGASLDTTEASDLPLHPARWWKELDGLRVECELCPKKCRVADRERGTCGVRENVGGKYYTLVHSRPCSLHVDPIEKKPFNHVLPGTPSLSIAIAALAIKHRTPTIACTYTEPVVFSEYVHDIAVAARNVKVRTVLVSNGFILEKPLDDLIEVLGAVKIDLKAFTEKFYKEVCGGELKPVLDTLRRLRGKGMWTEIVVLVVPTLNDSEAEIRRLSRFVRDDLGAEVPIHFTRFHPSYRIKNLPRTPVATLERAYDIARAEGLLFPYVGNVPGHPGNNTYCPHCGKIVIRRVGMAVMENRLASGGCPACRKKIPGVWS
jgi:pyruvate formate lyase activating enzyme